MLKQILKMIGLIIGSLVVLIVVAGVLFLNFSPEFGGKASDEQLEQYAKSANFKIDKFVNKEEVKLSFTAGQYVEMIFKFFGTQPNAVPDKSIPVISFDSTEIAVYDSDIPRLIWFGHSAFLLQISGKNILIDPMFGDVPAPHPWLGKSRFSKSLPIEIEKLPYIDVVILSHDHYDHLDYGSINRLASKVKQFYTPLGVGNHLTAWGIDANKVKELDWWDKVNLGEFTFVCTPAQHFSGRGISDNAATLWASWVIKSENHSIFFSGDSGYNTHFKEIGEKYGPFDIAMIECGQYNEQWKQIHMMPEETVLTGIDLKAELIMPIHWAAFKLAFHTWTDPIERVTKKAKEMNLPITTPMIGEPIILDKQKAFPNSEWWTR
jgi:L-ascorbate metabolism protein UlaG (beta-lactamase superfamily)